MLGPQCLVFEEAIHLGYDTVSKQYKWCQTFQRAPIPWIGWEHVPHQPWGPPSLLYSGYLTSFPGVKQPGHGVDHPHLSSTMVKLGTAIPLSLQCISDGMLWADFYLFFSLYILDDVGNITLQNVQKCPCIISQKS